MCVVFFCPGHWCTELAEVHRQAAGSPAAAAAGTDYRETHAAGEVSSQHVSVINEN